MAIRVMVNGVDISRYVIKVDSSEQTIGQPGELIINDINSLEGNNTDQFWDTSFGNINDLSTIRVYITKDDYPIFTGSIREIVNEGFISKVTIQSDIQQAMEKSLVYVTQDELDTPASAIRNICGIYGLSFDNESFAAAHALYSLDAVYIKCNIDAPTLTVLDAITQLCNIGVASVYSFHNKLYFNMFVDDRDTGSNITIHVPLSKPVLTKLYKKESSGYNITTLQGIAEQSSLNNPISIEAGTDADIQIVSLQAGYWIGERWIYYNSYLHKTIEFQTDVPNIPLNSTFTYNNIDYDVIAVDNTSRLGDTIRGITR